MLLLHGMLPQRVAVRWQHACGIACLVALVPVGVRGVLQEGRHGRAEGGAEADDAARGGREEAAQEAREEEVREGG